MKLIKILLLIFLSLGIGYVFFVNYKKDYLLSKNIDLLDKNNNTVKFSKLFEDHNELLIFRFTELNCDLCYLSVLNILERYHENTKIVIISSYNSTRSFKMFLKELDSDLVIYNIKDQIFNVKLDNLMVPYFCVINKNFKISNMFIPEKKKRNDTEKYLGLCLKK